MDSILGEYLWKFCVVYLDDIIIYSGTEAEHAQHVKIIKDKIADAGLVLNQEKCEFGKKEIDMDMSGASVLSSKDPNFDSFLTRDSYMELSQIKKPTLWELFKKMVLSKDL